MPTPSHTHVTHHTHWFWVGHTFTDYPTTLQFIGQTRMLDGFCGGGRRIHLLLPATTRVRLVLRLACLPSPAHHHLRTLPLLLPFTAAWLLLLPHLPYITCAPLPITTLHSTTYTDHLAFPPFAQLVVFCVSRLVVEPRSRGCLTLPVRLHRWRACPHLPGRLYTRHPTCPFTIPHLPTRYRFVAVSACFGVLHPFCHTVALPHVTGLYLLRIPYPAAGYHLYPYIHPCLYPDYTLPPTDVVTTPQHAPRAARYTIHR